MNIDEKYLNDGTVQTIWHMFNTGSKKIFKKIPHKQGKVHV